MVWSLTVIEPGAFGLLRGDPVVESLIEQDEACYARKETMTPEEFYICLAQAGGGEVPLPLDPPLTDMDRAAIASSMLEPKPWEVDLPLELLREALFPKLVVSGGGRQGSTESVRAGRNVANRVCDLLADHIGGRRVVVPGVGHNSQLEDPKTFNQALREFLRFASALRS